MDVAHSFLKSHSLNVQNLLTAHITLFFYRRYERIGGKLPGKRGLFHFHIKFLLDFTHHAHEVIGVKPKVLDEPGLLFDIRRVHIHILTY